MEVITFSLTISVAVLGLALLSNKYRSQKDYKFDLEPNCLLTRWPLLFVTGHRSIFYFSRYWNIYTLFLAEHGYEVFTLHLPWNNKNLRRKKFKQFIEEQIKTQGQFHLVLDEVTFKEFRDLIHSAPEVFKSVTELKDQNFSEQPGLAPFQIPKNTLEYPKGPRNSPLLYFCHKLHRRITKSHPLPSLNALGANPKTAVSNSLMLLERMKTLAEQDLIQG